MGRRFCRVDLIGRYSNQLHLVKQLEVSCATSVRAESGSHAFLPFRSH